MNSQTAAGRALNLKWSSPLQYMVQEDRGEAALEKTFWKRCFDSTSTRTHTNSVQYNGRGVLEIVVACWLEIPKTCRKSQVRENLHASVTQNAQTFPEIVLEIFGNRRREEEENSDDFERDFIVIIRIWHLMIWYIRRIALPSFIGAIPPPSNKLENDVQTRGEERSPSYFPVPIPFTKRRSYSYASSYDASQNLGGEWYWYAQPSCTTQCREGACKKIARLHAYACI